MSSFLLNLSRLAFIRFGAILLTFLAQTWIIKIFGPQEYGSFVYFIALTSVVTVLSKGGLDVLLLKRIAVAVSNCESIANIASLRWQYLSKGLITSAAISTVVALSVMIFSSGRQLEGAAAWILFYIAAIGTVSFQILLGFERGRGSIVAADIFEQIARVSIMLAAISILSVFSLGNTSKLQLAYAISFSVVTWLVFSRYPPAKLSPFKLGILSTNSVNDSPYKFRQHASFTASGLLTFVFFQLDGLILSYHVNPIELGAYNMACNLGRLVIFFPMILLVIFQSRISVAFGANDQKLLVRYFLTVTSVSLLGAGLTAVFFLSFGRYILESIDPALGIAYPALKVLLVVYLINSFLMVIGAFSVLSKKYVKLVIAQAIGALVTAASYLALISVYGTVGAAWSVMIGLLIVILSASWLFWEDLLSAAKSLMLKT